MLFKFPDQKFKTEVYNTPISDTYKNIYTTGQAVNKEAENFIENNKQTHINDQN